MKFGLSQPMQQATANFENLVQGNKRERKILTFFKVSDNDESLAVELILSPESFVTRSYNMV